MRFLILTFSALIAALVIGTQAMAQGYRIQAGDVLAIDVVEDPTLNREALVLPGGTISFPIIGTLSVGGLTVDQVQTRIANGIASNFSVMPKVFVSVSALASQEVLEESGEDLISIYLIGEVVTPGVHQIARGSRLLQGLSLSGGFTNFAALKRIQLRRVNPKTSAITVVKLDYRALTKNGVIPQDPVLIEGDVIIVPQRRLFE
ncbi:MAG: polysaccharide biosynthesis/export family protein [Paracoccaceae bacterium]